MRLLKRLERAERRAAAAAPPRACGLVWTSYESRIDALALSPGELVAVDVTVVKPEVLHCQEWSLRERVTTDPADLGWLLSAAGDRIGRVVTAGPDLVEYELWPVDGGEGVEGRLLLGGESRGSFGRRGGGGSAA